MRIMLAALLVVVSDSQALAKIQFCNKFNHPIFVALAYQQNNDWVSDGWIEIDTNKCLIDVRHPDLTSFYYYGETDAFDKTRWSWGKGKQFSVRDGSFAFRHADTQQSGARFVQFSGPQTYKLPETVVQLQFEADMTTSFTVPSENRGAGPPSSIDVARDDCDNKSGDVAIQGCTSLISSNPNDAVAYFNRGIEYANKRDWDRAIVDYSRAIGIKPDYVKAYNSRGSSFFNGKDDYGHAIADFTKAIDLDSKYLNPLMTAAMCIAISTPMMLR